MAQVMSVERWVELKVIDCLLADLSLFIMGHHASMHKSHWTHYFVPTPNKTHSPEVLNVGFWHTYLSDRKCVMDETAYIWNHTGRSHIKANISMDSQEKTPAWIRNNVDLLKFHSGVIFHSIEVCIAPLDRLDSTIYWQISQWASAY